MIKVSAIIPVFNGSATLREAIDSVLDQSSHGLELIVVDDGSTDSTPAILESYGDRIKQLRQSNAGPAVARNAGPGTHAASISHSSMLMTDGCPEC